MYADDLPGASVIEVLAGMGGGDMVDLRRLNEACVTLGLLPGAPGSTHGTPPLLGAALAPC